MADGSHISRVMLALLGLAVCVFVLASLVSFNIQDWPNPDVAPAAVRHNWCGPAGAWVAYQLHYWLGPASWALLAGAVTLLVMQVMRKELNQFVLRAIGVVLMGAVLSAATYILWPGGPNSLTIGNGGILGVSLGHFLQHNMAATGAALALLAALVVGALLAVDELVFMLPKLLWGLVRKLQGAPVLVGSGVGGWVNRRGAEGSLDMGTAVMEEPVVEDAEEEEEEEEYEEVEEEEEPEDEYEEEEEEVEDEEEEVEDAEAEDEEDEEADAEAEEEAAVAEVEEIEAEAEEEEEDDRPRELSVQAVSEALARMRGVSPNTGSAAGEAANEDFSGYIFPDIELLEEPERGYSEVQERMVKQQGEVLQRTLREFNIDATVVNADSGPVITMYELKLAPGVKVSQISNLSNDLARSLGAGAVRVVAPIPGKHTIGIEVPNSEKEKVRIKELLGLVTKKVTKMQIPLFLGKDASGAALTVDLTEMPHCLIAGTTGSGKSVCINSIIVSILMTQRPDLVKLILVDPKMVEMNAFRDAPHLMCPIVTEMKKAEQILEWLTVKMDERYAILAEARVRNIAGYNELGAERIYELFCPSTEEEKAKIPVRLPYMVIVIDELADLMMTSAKEVEGFIIRLAQKSRAVGIHIILATQRPQATVVTGLIKSNLPARISFRVSGRMDSRIVLDQNGAEALLGQGDMLFLQPGTSELRRAQGTFMSDGEIHGVMDHLRSVAAPTYNVELVQLNRASVGECMEQDELFDEAVKIILETGRGSVSLLQRRLTIGYSRASRLIDQMALAGIVGDYKGSQAREVMITPEEYASIQKQVLNESDDGDSGEEAFGGLTDDDFIDDMGGLDVGAGAATEDAIDTAPVEVEVEDTVETATEEAEDADDQAVAEAPPVAPWLRRGSDDGAGTADAIVEAAVTEVESPAPEAEVIETAEDVVKAEPQEAVDVVEVEQAVEEAEIADAKVAKKPAKDDIAVPFGEADDDDEPVAKAEPEEFVADEHTIVVTDEEDAAADVAEDDEEEIEDELEDAEDEGEVEDEWEEDEDEEEDEEDADEAEDELEDEEDEEEEDGDDEYEYVDEEEVPEDDEEWEEVEEEEVVDEEEEDDDGQDEDEESDENVAEGELRA